MSSKDRIDKIIELLKDDKEIHDATVRLIDSLTELNKETAIRMKEKRVCVDYVR